MQISVHYTRDLKRTFRATARLRRTVHRVFRVIGALFLLAAFLLGTAGGLGIAVVPAVCGAVIVVEPAIVLWLSLRRNREAIVVDVDMEVTDRGISRRTATESMQVGWEMVQRVIETGDFWIFVVSRLQVAPLYKSDLTPDQRAELTAFLARRPQNAAKDQPSETAAGLRGDAGFSG